MASVELLVVLTVASFHLAIVSGREGTDLLVPKPQLCQCFLKERQRLFLAVAHLVGKFKSVVRLDALNGIGKFQIGRASCRERV